MKKLFYGLVFISSAALMAMDTEKLDSGDDSSLSINDNKNISSTESPDSSLGSENHDSIGILNLLQPNLFQATASSL